MKLDPDHVRQETNMSVCNRPHSPGPAYELRFHSLVDEARTFHVPCDATDGVDIDSLSERSRIDYLFARTLIGREFAAPAVRLSVFHSHGKHTCGVASSHGEEVCPSTSSRLMNA
ncbi:MAG: hypothetical protein ABI702_25225 [Burkholderiales bacterium]